MGWQAAIQVVNDNDQRFIARMKQVNQILELRAEFIEKGDMGAEAQFPLELRKIKVNIAHEQVPELPRIEGQDTNDGDNGRDENRRNACGDERKSGGATGQGIRDGRALYSSDDAKQNNDEPQQ